MKKQILIASLFLGLLFNVKGQPPKGCPITSIGWEISLSPFFGIISTGEDCQTRVGIGVNIPSSTLDVDGNITMRSGAVAGYIPVSNASGTMVWTNPSILNNNNWTINGNDIYRLGGNVGIGANNPTTLLDVNGSITMRSGAISGYIPVSDSTGTMTWTNPSILGLWQETGSNIYFNAGNVGIGTSASTSS